MFPNLLNPSAKPSAPHWATASQDVFLHFPPGSVGPPPASLLRGTGAASLGVLGTAVEAIRQNTGVMEKEKGECGLLLRAGYGETSGRFRQNREDGGKEMY